MRLIPELEVAMHRSARMVGVLLLLSVCAFSGAEARSYSHHSSRSYRNHPYGPRALPGVPRDSHGRVKRSETAKREFEKESGYPHGRPGYVVDHIVPLSRGGSDTPSNM